MSQFYIASGGSSGPITNLEGNDGVLVTPSGGVINVVGNGVVGSGISTAGNVYTTGSGSTLTINETQAQFLTNYNATNIDFAHSPYVVSATDFYISVDCSAGSVTVKLPNAPTIYRRFVVKDRTGNSTTNNIFIQSVNGLVTIDGTTNYKIEDNFEAIELAFNGTSYEVF